jgi:ABC-type bacteriocin/lantibiotic exporter with double-glycine peptidase domain
MIKYIIDMVYNFIKSIEEILSPGSVLLNMKRSIQLDSYSCGVQCVKMILNYYSIIKTPGEIKRGLKTKKEEGTDTEPILNYLRKSGLKVSVNKNAVLSNIHFAIANSNPVLISIDNGEHWIIVYGYSANSIFTLDPSGKSISNKWELKEFFNRWDENWIAVIVGEII